ncbi:MAG TPA: restriction endonuclease [Ramlibacter sp.]|nr:restriction endonuclease [Ramlibacter sp.]
MQLKMAPNSLFAILLRSRWWISLALAALVVAASRALLAPEYWPFGAMGALPFIAIALISLGRQLRKPGSRRVEAVLQAVRGMSWRDFSQALEEAFTRDGFAVQRIEGAADFTVTRAGRTALVAARRWKAARHGEEALAALHAQMRARDASECTYIALGQLSDNAQRFASANGIQVMQEEGLAQLLRAMPLAKG